LIAAELLQPGLASASLSPPLRRRLNGALAIVLWCAAASAAQAQDALSPAGGAWLHAAISSGRSDLRWPDFTDYAGDVARLYALNGNALLWVKGLAPTPQALQMIALLQAADRKGLSPDDYDGGRWTARLAKLSPAVSRPRESDAAEFDLALTVCAMRYISDLHNGKVNPNRLAFALDVQSKKYDLAEFISEHIARVDDIAAALAQVEPSYPGYRRTLAALQTYLELARKDDADRLPPPYPAAKNAVAPGDVYPGIPRLARLLRLLGDLPADFTLPPGQTRYEAPLVDAVKTFQRRHGRDPSGRIDRQTLADLNVPLTRRIQQMNLTLERWRWLPVDCQTPLIVVNIPEFRLRAYGRDFTAETTMKVVVGKSYAHKTPVFSSMMTYLIFQPYWDVPRSIVLTEQIPQLLKDPEYLTKENLELTDRQQHVVNAGTVTDRDLDQLRAGNLLVRQRPGPDNALGRVKFVFANSHDVYLHDTPAKALFANSRRDFSHGCIRLENAFDLATWVLRDNPGWTPTRIRAAIDASEPQRVDLAHPIPVAILYATVIVPDDGSVGFYDDIYGHDSALQRALAKGYPYPR